jgi:hypothetical protein
MFSKIINKNINFHEERKKKKLVLFSIGERFLKSVEFNYAWLLLLFFVVVIYLDDCFIQ